MFPYVMGGGGQRTCWGSGALGNLVVAPSSNVSFDGVLEYKNLTISAGNIVHIGKAGAVIFATRSIVLEDDVYVAGQYYSDQVQMFASYSRQDSDILLPFGSSVISGGGGGGSGGSNFTTPAASSAGRTFVMRNTSYDIRSSVEIVSSRNGAGGGGGVHNRAGNRGGAGIDSVIDQATVEAEYGFTSALRDDGTLDFPVFHGGGGGNGSFGGPKSCVSQDCDAEGQCYCNVWEWNVVNSDPGRGGYGGSQIILIAPHIEFGSRVTLDVHGQDRNDGYSVGGDGLSGRRNGDGGSGCGGGGGGGFTGLVYKDKVGTPTIDISGGISGHYQSGGNSGQLGGDGGDGLSVEIQRRRCA